MKIFFKVINLILLIIYPFSSFGDEYEEVQEGKRYMYTNNLRTDYPVKAQGRNHFYHNTTLTSDGDTICFIGDTGSGENNQKLAADLLIKNTNFNERNYCKQIRHLGDIIYTRGIQDTVNLTEVKSLFVNYYDRLIKDGGVPFYLALGNHDYYGNIEKWFDIAQSNPNLKFPYYYYADNYSGLCLVTIDSNALFEQGFQPNEKAGGGPAIDSPRYHAQLAWFRTIKNSLKNCKMKVLISHHPSKMPSGRALEGLIFEFYKNEILGKFDLFIAGHDHLVAYMGDHLGTPLLITGGGGKTIREEVKKTTLEYLKTNPIPWISFNPGFIKMVVKRNQRKELTGLDIYSIIHGEENKLLLSVLPKAR